jgi:peptidyl-prolyl cis-trans isomerase D
VLQGLFGQAKGQVFSQPGEGGYLVGRVDGVHAANPAVAGPLAEQARPRITQELVQAMVQTEMTAGAQRSKAKNDVALARQALGLSAEPTAPAAPAQ